MRGQIRQSMYTLLVLIILIQFTRALGCAVINCTACDPMNNSTCQTCDSGFKVVNQTCCDNALLNCSSCSVDTSSCDSCISSSYCMNNRSCTACTDHMSNCVTCTNCSSCLTCKNNTFAINSSNFCQLCSSLMPLCLKCSNSTVCTNCVNNSYGVNSTSHQCQLCSTLLNYCTNCNSDTQCVSCTGSPLIVLSSGKCKNCGSVISNCVNCVKTNNCTLCGDYYAILVTASSWTCSLCGNLMYGCLNCSSATVCVKCSLGKIVTMGCSSVPGCTSVIQKYPISVCTSCDFTEYQVLPINGTCSCIKGFIAGQYCTEIIGCTNIVRNTSGDFCTNCNERDSFFLDNTTCNCLPYFLPSGQTCKEICGDGRLYVLACDDGNLINGDGCSSSCKVESGYHCIAGHNNTASVCKYQGRIKAELVCVYKHDTPNTAKIQISFSPFVSNLLRINFLNYVSFNFTALCNVSSVQFSGDILQITVSYLQDLQSSQVSILVQYDPYYILSPESLITTIIKECNGDRLIYDPDSKSSSKQLFSLIAKVISLLTLLFWLLGSYSHKLIGVETIQTIHLIFIMQAFAPRYKPVVAYFIGLFNSMNFFSSMISKSSTISSSSLQRLNYSPDIVYNFGIVAIVQLLFLLVFTVCSILRFVNTKMIDKIADQVWSEKIFKYKSFVYNVLVFPTLIGFFFSFTISMQIYSANSISKSYKYFVPVAAAVFAIFIATAIVFFDEWKYVIISEESAKINNYHTSYVAYYLTYLLILSFVISLSLNQLAPFSLYAFAVVVTIYFIFIIVYRPYKDCLHNIGLVINQVGLIFNLAWLISQDFIYLNRSIDEIIAFALVGWMALILLWSIVRIVFELRKPAVSQVGKKKQVKQRVVQTYKQYQQQIVRAILMQTESSINYHRLTSQLLQSKKSIYAKNKMDQNNKAKELLRNRFRYKATDETEIINSREKE